MISNARVSQKLEILQTYQTGIIEAETFEEITKYVFDAIDATIDPVIKIIGQVHSGAIRGFYQIRGEEIGVVRGEADGILLDGPGIMVRAVNSKKTSNVPDTREDPNYLDPGENFSTLSEIAAPILFQGKSIGVINIEETRVNAFDLSDQQVLETLSRYAGVSLSRILYAFKLNSLHKHTSQLSVSTSIEEVAKQTLEAMTDTLDFESCVFLLNQVGALQTVYEKGLEESIRLREKAVNYFRIIGSEHSRGADDIEFLSELEAPVNIENEVVAILSAKSIKSEKYTVQDKQLLEILANHVASAIQRIRMLEERAQYEAKLESLHTSALKLVNTETLEDIGRFIRAHAISDILDYEWVGLGFVHDNIIRYFYDTKDEQTPERIQREYVINLNDNTIITRAAKTGEIQDIPNTELDPDFICTVFNDEGEPLIKSEYTIPIIQFGKVVAILNAESTRFNAFSEQYKKLLEILASHVSSAIQRIRLLEEQKQYEAKLEALHVHTSNLADAESIKEIAEYTINAMSTTLGYQWGLFLLLKDDHLVSLGMLGEYIERGYAAPDIPLDHPGVTTRTAKTGKTQLVNDTRLDPDFYSSDNTLSELDVPIKIEDKVIGVLNVESLELNAFSEQDQELLEILASHVASSIQRIKLLEEQQKYEAKLEALHLHTTKLADAESIEEISEHTIDAMETTLGFSFAAFNIVEDTIWRRLIHSRAGIHTYGDDHPIHIDGPGIGARAIRTKKTQLVNDVRKDIDYIGPFMNENTFSKLGETHKKDLLEELKRDASADHWRSLSELDVPVKIDQSVVAVLNAESNKLNAFTEQDMYLLEILASHVSSAIQRIRFQEEQRQYEDLLEARAKKLETVNKDLEKEIDTRKVYEQEIVRVARESEVDRLRSQFLSTITHELRTPLTSIKGYLEVIRSGWVGDVSPEMNESLEVIIRNTDRLSTLTSDLLDIQRIASGRLEVDLKTIDLKKVIEQSVKEIGPVLSEKKQILDLEIPEESLEIIGDSQRLNQVLMNLLNNASKFSNEETTIHLKVKTDDEKILVSVKDSGIGILEPDLDRVFTPLAMIEKPIYVKGTGLGLSISKGLIDLHNGRIWAESEGEWKGSTFTIQLPKGG